MLVGALRPPPHSRLEVSLGPGRSLCTRVHLESNSEGADPQGTPRVEYKRRRSGQGSSKPRTAVGTRTPSEELGRLSGSSMCVQSGVHLRIWRRCTLRHMAIGPSPARSLIPMKSGGFGFGFNWGRVPHHTQGGGGTSGQNYAHFFLKALYGHFRAKLCPFFRESFLWAF